MSDCYEYDNKVNPRELIGLRQAVFVLCCKLNGMTNSKIVELFQGDRQLVQLWMSFMRHNEWIRHDKLTDHSDDKWVVTDKGKEMIKKYEQSKTILASALCM